MSTASPTPNAPCLSYETAGKRFAVVSTGRFAPVVVSAPYPVQFAPHHAYELDGGVSGALTCPIQDFDFQRD